ncbi:hypothetical protein AABB24_005474 [Solanum stoloniferum]|uniref:Uncharacterized protein n=1 Tax=Solanum stoloniferum TaxID=62892 RepID=A0ABD2UXD3_9SOLN
MSDTNITFDLHILEPSITCSSFITKSFRSEVDPNGINWRSVSNDVKDGYFGEFKKQIQRIVVAAVKLLLGLTRVALFQLENIARDLLLKRVGIQHQPSYICTYIHMVMMESLLLMSVLELFLKYMKRFYRKKWHLNLILINLKHITKLQAEKRREEYTVLDLKQKITTSISFVPHHLYDLQFLNQH